MEKSYNEIILEVKDFLDKFENDKNLKKVAKKYFRGIQILFTPLIQNPKFMFIGINPGAGYFNNEGKKINNVKRFSPMQNSEYVGQEYRLAKETRKLFELARISKMELKNSVKSNYYFLATKNTNDLLKLIKELEKHEIEKLSEKWIYKLVEIVKPEYIICEGKTVFEKFTKSNVSQDEEVYFKEFRNLKVIGYKRKFSFIVNKEKVAKLLKDKLAEKP